MSKAAEIKERACALRVEKRELEARLGQARGREETAIEKDLARVKEDLVDCARQLRELLPGHRIGRGGATWSGVEGWRWDRIQHQTWTELEGADLPEGPTDRDKMRLAVRAARRGVTQAQEKYLAEADQGKKAAQIARETGRHRSTVCRTLRRGEKRIAEDARALYQLLGRQEGGPMVVDLSRPDVLKAVLDRLTIRQQTYLYLYYGEWLSLREIGSLLGVDHASVLRSIRCGLKRVESLSLGGQIEVRGLDHLEERLMEHFNDLPPAEEVKPRRSYRKVGLPARTPKPVTLVPLLLRFIRRGQTRMARLGEPRLELGAKDWGSGRLLEWLKQRRSEQPEKKSLLRRLLYHLFIWIRRDLDVEHH